MRCLLVHNSYQQAGGEDQVFRAEAGLLEAHGHHVVRYTAHNDRVGELGRVALARTTIWNGAAYREVRALLRRAQVELVHVHNTFPLISPAVHYAARAERVPVVQTLHNYRLVCPNALLFRDGRVCVDCVGKHVPVPGVVHACYRGSRAASGVTAAMLATHRALGTWTRAVDVFIALSEFAREQHIKGGLPAERIVVKPNFVDPDPGPREGDEHGGYALFVGRLTPEKGVDTLLAAWERVGRTMPLRIVGDGPLAERVRAVAQRVAGVEWCGAQSRERVLAHMRGAGLLVVPSLWYEPFGVVVAEAFGVGLPVLASDLGNLLVMVREGDTGLHFRTGDAADLARVVQWAALHREEMAEMGRRARREFEARYTAERNYDMLMHVYELAIERASRRLGRHALVHASPCRVQAGV